MLEWWNHFSLLITDALLNWMLRLPTDVVLFIVAIGTSTILTVTRVFTTNQKFLGRADRDKSRLGALIKQAKLASDKPAIKRYRMTKSMIAMKTLSSEGMPLLVSILPIALLATWAMFRLEFHPPKGDQPVEVVFYAPMSSIGTVMHLVPESGLSTDNGAWARQVVAGKYAGQDTGVATWKIRAKAQAKPYNLTFRLKDQSYHRELLIGQRTYSAPFVYNPDETATDVKLQPVKLFNIVAIPEKYNYIAIPPWMLAYLLIVIPFVVILKRVLRIY